MKTVHLMTLQASERECDDMASADDGLRGGMFSCSRVNNWKSVAICCQSPGFTVLVHNLMLSCLPGDVLVHIIS